MKACPKKPPGKNIREAQRTTVAVKLRLPPEVAEELEELAAGWNITVSGAVARLMAHRWLTDRVTGIARGLRS